MNFEDLDQRLDLDTYMKDVAKAYPKNDDDYFFYFRGKDSTKEYFVATAAEHGKLGYILFNLSLQDEGIKEEILTACEAIIEHEKIEKPK